MLFTSSLIHPVVQALLSIPAGELIRDLPIGRLAHEAQLLAKLAAPGTKYEPCLASEINKIGLV